MVLGGFEAFEAMLLVQKTKDTEVGIIKGRLFFYFFPSCLASSWRGIIQEITTDCWKL